MSLSAPEQQQILPKVYSGSAKRLVEQAFKLFFVVVKDPPLISPTNEVYT